MGKRVIKAKVGNVSGFSSFDEANDKTRILVQVVKETGQNSNNIERKTLFSESTLSGSSQDCKAKYFNSVK